MTRDFVTTPRIITHARSLASTSTTRRGTRACGWHSRRSASSAAAARCGSRRHASTRRPGANGGVNTCVVTMRHHVTSVAAAACRATSEASSTAASCRPTRSTSGSRPTTTGRAPPRDSSAPPLRQMPWHGVRHASRRHAMHSHILTAWRCRLHVKLRQTAKIAEDSSDGDPEEIGGRARAPDQKQTNQRTR